MDKGCISKKTFIEDNSRCAVIVAHPDDETLWAGGLILLHPKVRWTIISLCRKNDSDRAPKFFNAVKEFNAAGFMADIDDGPEQRPLNQDQIKQTINELLPSGNFDIIITHSKSGEYTRHLRHEETALAVLDLWNNGKIKAEQLWSFAYEDDNRRYLPRAIETSDLLIDLKKHIWQKKYDIITKIYGFNEDSFEAKTTPRCEAFCCFKSKVTS
ncbi:MAG: PIG-L family deacetylase [Phycisphaerae bacterium]